jgi:hypothetical protein
VASGGRRNSTTGGGWQRAVVVVQRAAGMLLAVSCPSTPLAQVLLGHARDTRTPGLRHGGGGLLLRQRWSTGWSRRRVWGDVAAGENCTQTSVLTDDGAVVWRCYLVEGIVFACLVISPATSGSCRLSAGAWGLLARFSGSLSSQDEDLLDTCIH